VTYTPPAAAAPIDTFGLPSGAIAENISRQVAAGNFTAMASQTLFLVAIGLSKGVPITSISFVSGSTALSVGVQQIFGLYDSSRALLRATSDDTSTAWGTNTVKTLNLTSSFTPTYAGLHYAGILVNAATVPSLRGVVGVTTVLGLAPILAGTSSTLQTSLPDPAAAITATANTPYCYVS
jgi:hypothetical protein